ncbi:MAG: 23S rRNA (guanosine(2251)-2'-O)-methyltransferase RlmB [Deltaproteobacteria bacterium]|nr:23S rRNA (guanosine(2251)-2'-O)-methyltransferase RlmB [Deltaproteobacteria bacterium]
MKPRPAGPAGGDFVYGMNPVERALISGRRSLKALWLKEGRLSPRMEELVRLARQRNLPVSQVAGYELDQRLGHEHHQGVVLVAGPLPALEEQDLWNLTAPQGKAEPGTLVVALDEVEDPQNLGAIARNCAAFGVAALVVGRRHTAPLSPAASKASAGWLEWLPVVQAANLSRFLGEAKKRGFWVVGATGEGDQPLAGFQPPGAVVLVLGNEGRGLRQLVAAQCDFKVAIATRQGASLNVASASALFLHHLAGEPSSVDEPGFESSASPGFLP